MPAVRNVRSLGPSKNQKGIPIHVYVPPTFNPIHKIIVSDGSTDYDITDLVIEGEYTDGITSTIGNFQFTIDNSAEVYTNSFKLWNELKVYLDYGTTATTLRFTGKIERPSRTDNKIVLSGRSLAARTIGKNVTYNAVDKSRSEVLIEIIEKYFSYITTTNVTEDTELITIDYFDVPFWEVVEDICGRGSYDAYIDHSSDFHYFKGESITNPSEVVVHTHNLLETGDFSPDLQQVSNRVKVYGKENNGIPLISTADDTDLQALYDVKEMKIDDGSLVNSEQTQARADFELAQLKDPPTVGEVKSLMLPTIQPGEMIRISDPQNGLEPKPYQIQKYVQSFSNDDPPMTTLTVQKERADIPNILKSRLKFETEITSNPNPNEMDYTKVYDFSTSVGTFVTTERAHIDGTDGGYYVLKTTSGNSTGSWTSPTYELSEDIAEVEFRVEGDKLAGTPPEGTKIEYSFDGGSTFQTWSSSTVTVPSGRDLVIKVNLSSAETEVKAVAALYKF